ncbi:MAG TPA: membrane dipeptidase [Sphingobium sp.]
MIGAAAGALAFAAPAILKARHRVFKDSAAEFSSRAITLVRESLVIDLLNQFLYRIDQKAQLDRWLDSAGAFTRPDWLRFMDTGVNAISFGDGAETYADGVKLFARWNAFIERYPAWLIRIDEAADFDRARISGRYGIMYGSQDGGHIRSPSDVDVFHAAGERLTQLTYNGKNALASGAFVEVDEGVTELGARVIARMNSVGMGVDIAHASDRTKFDVLDISKRPVLLSHGTCRALNNHPRTASDEAITRLARSGGVMGVAFVANMLKDKPSELVTVDDVIDHIDHIGKLVGFEHVGIGSDAGIETHDLAPLAVQRQFWSHISPRYKQQGMREAAVGLDGPKKIYALTDGLVRRGYTDAHIRMILGQNWYRALNAIWTRS